MQPTFGITGREGGLKGFCMKCQTERELVDTEAVVMKNGRPATKGRCPVCGTGMFRLGKADQKGAKASAKTKAATQKL
ncbi:MAG: DUF5679 domain-containing protein [Chloroflexota bacterium]